jgi:hypothetical protein
MQNNKLTPDALAIMAAIFIMGDDDTSAEEALRYARDIEDELFRPPSPADAAALPPETPHTIHLTIAEARMIQRGLASINEAWSSAWRKVYAIGVKDKL